MLEVKFSDKIKDACPGLKVLQIEAEVSNKPTSDALWSRIEEAARELSTTCPLQELNKRPAIGGTRKAYKALGKDPNRYRPSAEALGRRIINGKGIYRLLTLIDIINLISIKTGYSIGGFDLSKISGSSLTLDVGKADDNFTAIGRGSLNIEGLPLYRDALGGIGTPTSDEERTKLDADTTKLLMLVNIYEEEYTPEDIEKMTFGLLAEFAGLKSFQAQLHTVSKED